MSQIIYTPEDQQRFLDFYGGSMNVEANLDLFYIINDLSLSTKRGYIQNVLTAIPNLQGNPTATHARKKSDICFQNGIRQSDFKRFFREQDKLSDTNILFRKSKRSFIKTKFYAEIGIDGDYMVYQFGRTWGSQMAKIQNDYATFNSLALT